MLKGKEKPVRQWAMSEIINVPDPTGEFPGGINKLAIYDLGLDPNTTIIYNVPHDAEGNTILGPIVCLIETKDMKPFRGHENCDLLPEVGLDSAPVGIAQEVKTAMMSRIEARHGAGVKSTINTKLTLAKPFREIVNTLGKLTDSEFDVDNYEARAQGASQ